MGLLGTSVEECSKNKLRNFSKKWTSLFGDFCPALLVLCFVLSLLILNQLRLKLFDIGIKI